MCHSAPPLLHPTGWCQQVWQLGGAGQLSIRELDLCQGWVDSCHSPPPPHPAIASSCTTLCSVHCTCGRAEPHQQNTWCSLQCLPAFTDQSAVAAAPCVMMTPPLPLTGPSSAAPLLGPCRHPQHLHPGGLLWGGGGAGLRLLVRAMGGGGGTGGAWQAGGWHYLSSSMRCVQANVTIQVLTHNAQGWGQLGGTVW